VFEGADEMYLYAVAGNRSLATNEGFCGYGIITQRVIETEEKRAAIRTALYSAIQAGEEVMRCFVPHHGIRATYAENSVDIIICFMCAHVWSYYQGERSGTVISTSVPEELSYLVL